MFVGLAFGAGFGALLGILRMSEWIFGYGVLGKDILFSMIVYILTFGALGLGLGALSLLLPVARGK
jgi:hypothetical protein